MIGEVLGKEWLVLSFFVLNGGGMCVSFFYKWLVPIWNIGIVVEMRRVKVTFFFNKMVGMEI